LLRKDWWVNIFHCLKPHARQLYLALSTLAVVYHCHVPICLTTYFSPTSDCPNGDVVQWAITWSCIFITATLETKNKMFSSNHLTSEEQCQFARQFQEKQAPQLNSCNHNLYGPNWFDQSTSEMGFEILLWD
jgi:hypothetical protein